MENPFQMDGASDARLTHASSINRPFDGIIQRISDDCDRKRSRRIVQSHYSQQAKLPSFQKKSSIQAFKRSSKNIDVINFTFAPLPEVQKLGLLPKVGHLYGESRKV